MVLHKQRLITQNSQISDIFILFVRHKSHRTHIAGSSGYLKTTTNIEFINLWNTLYSLTHLP